MYYNVFCNINHCNDSAPCWDLDWIITSYLIFSMYEKTTAESCNANLTTGLVLTMHKT